MSSCHLGKALEMQGAWDRHSPAKPTCHTEPSVLTCVGGASPLPESDRSSTGSSKTSADRCAAGCGRKVSNENTSFRVQLFRKDLPKRRPALSRLSQSSAVTRGSVTLRLGHPSPPSMWLFRVEKAQGYQLRPESVPIKRERNNEVLASFCFCLFFWTFRKIDLPDLGLVLAASVRRPEEGRSRSREGRRTFVSGSTRVVGLRGLTRD